MDHEQEFARDKDSADSGDSHRQQPQRSSGAADPAGVQDWEGGTRPGHGFVEQEQASFFWPETEAVDPTLPRPGAYRLVIGDAAGLEGPAPRSGRPPVSPLDALDPPGRGTQSQDGFIGHAVDQWPYGTAADGTGQVDIHSALNRPLEPPAPSPRQLPPDPPAGPDYARPAATPEMPAPAAEPDQPYEPYQSSVSGPTVPAPVGGFDDTPFPETALAETDLDLGVFGQPRPGSTPGHRAGDRLEGAVVRGAFDDLFGDAVAADPAGTGGLFPSGEQDGALASAPLGWTGNPRDGASGQGYDDGYWPDVTLGVPDPVSPAAPGHSLASDPLSGDPDGSPFLAEAGRAGGILSNDAGNGSYYGQAGNGPSGLRGEEPGMARARAMQVRPMGHPQPSSSFATVLADIADRRWFTAALTGVLMLTLVGVGWAVVAKGDRRPDDALASPINAQLSTSSTVESAAASALGPTTATSGSLPTTSSGSSETTTEPSVTTRSTVEPTTEISTEPVTATTLAATTTTRRTTTRRATTTAQPATTTTQLATTTTQPATTTTQLATTTTQPATTTTAVTVPESSGTGSGSTSGAAATTKVVDGGAAETTAPTEASPGDPML